MGQEFSSYWLFAGCFLLAGCPNPDPTLIPSDRAGDYRLEVLNKADDGARTEIVMWANFRLNKNRRELKYGSDRNSVGEPRNSSGVFDLSAGAKRTFFMMIGPGSGTPNDSRQLRGFSEIAFFSKESDVPYKRYVYELVLYCGGDEDCHHTYEIYGDEPDRSVIYRRSDGQEERLFVQDPDRPFYLERDREDRGLGRIVITFVPAADAEAG